MPSKPDITDLYQAYLNELKPLIAAIEGKYEIFPEGILKEVRALYDHISRLSILEMEEEAYNEEYQRAKRHIHRAKLDCFKILCTMGEIRSEKFEENYKNVRLGEVGSGKFLPEYEKLKKIARNKTLKAKMNEKSIAHNEKNVSLLYQEAVLEFEKVESFIDSTSENLAWSASNQKHYSEEGFKRAKRTAYKVGIAGTIVATIFLKIVWTIILKFLNIN